MDAKKAKSNFKNHSVRFAGAVAIFEDELALQKEDQYSDGEQRFIVLGMDFLGRLLMVIYTYRGESIRIISARKATKKERSNYESPI
ncbi:MAG: BrnT family toxin [Magnetococcales bacterium]|nr:BrnT family toxin [Magnetococcales bacterium]